MFNIFVHNLHDKCVEDRAWGRGESLPIFTNMTYSPH